MYRDGPLITGTSRPDARPANPVARAATRKVMEEGSDMTTCTYHCRPWDSHFTSLRAFDAHRQGPAGARRCEFPDAGLAERIGGCKLADPDVPKVNVTLYELESSEGYREYRRLKSGPDG